MLVGVNSLGLFGTPQTYNNEFDSIIIIFMLFMLYVITLLVQIHRFRFI